MKRSRSITLLFLAGAAITLTACGDDDTQELGSVYKNRDECIADAHTPSECDSALADAQKQHAANAPKFASQNACEAQYGPAGCQSQPNSDGTSSFMPFMMGYMMGNILNNRANTPMYYGPGSYQDDRDRDRRPVYSSGGGAAVAGRPLGYANTTGGKAAIFSPSRSTGGAPSSTSMNSARSTAASVGTSSSSSSSGAKASSSSRGGFGGIGGGRGGSFGG